MKNKYLIIFICVISSIVFGQNTKSKLIVNTNKTDCYIYLDGRLEGRGKLEIELTKGNYALVIKESLVKWTGKEVCEIINITGAATNIDKNYSFEKSILLSTTPQDAKVVANDSLIGYTPLYINSDLKNITLIKNNYDLKSIKLGKSEKENIALGNPINSNSGGFIKSTWFKVLIGTAAVFGATAAYYKIQADKKYDDYLVTRNSSMLSDVNHYDTVSGIALGALQINFGILLYFLLFE